MKFLKIIFSLVLLNFANLSYGQAINQTGDKEKLYWNNLVNIINISGKTIGYALHCDYEKDKIEQIYNFITPFIKKLKTQEEQNSANQILVNTVNNAKEKGPIASNINCQIFQKEFELIILAIKEKDFKPRIYQMDKPPI